jgi:cell division protein FtsB
MALKPIVVAVKHWLRPEHPRARNRRLLAVAVGLMLAWGLFGGQQGLFALLMSQREKGRLRAEIVSLKAQNQALAQKAVMLERHPEAYERTARERLLLMRPGETVYRFH